MKSLKEEIINLQPKKEFFVGIDSDGCVFDTMELKHKECFCPNTVKHWNLQKVSKYARETWDFVNLYSKSRGVNRFLALINFMELLKDRKEIKLRNVALPDLSPLKKWANEENELSNSALQRYLKKDNDPIIARALEWSLAINRDVADMVKGISPFPYVKESLEKLSVKADIIVVSQTPVEALQREWEENSLTQYVRLIAGQEYGTKKEHLQYAAIKKYPTNNILMIGDAPGDMQAAKDNGVLFYPINPGQEEQSWKRFFDEALDRFLQGRYSGEYEQKLIVEFNSLLPEYPSWKS